MGSLTVILLPNPVNQRPMIIIRINTEIPQSAQLFNDYVSGEYISMNLVKNLRRQNRLNKLKDSAFIRANTNDKAYSEKTVHYRVQMQKEGKVLQMKIK